MINGQSLQDMNVVSDSGSNYGFFYDSSMIMQKIGSDITLIPDLVWCLGDANEMWGLRCYSDNDGFYYNTNMAPTCDYTTGITDILLPQFNMTCTNPFYNELNISMHPHAFPVKLFIYNLHGQLMLSQIIPSKTLNINLETSDLSPGIYMLHLQSEKRTATKKVIKL